MKTKFGNAVTKSSYVDESVTKYQVVIDTNDFNAFWTEVKESLTNKKREVYKLFRDIEGSCIQLLKNQIEFYIYLDEDKFLTVRNISGKDLDRVLKKYEKINLKAKDIRIFFYKGLRSRTIFSWFRYDFCTKLEICDVLFKKSFQKSSFYKALKHLPNLQNVRFRSSSYGGNVIIESSQPNMASEEKFLSLIGLRIMQTRSLKKFEAALTVFRESEIGMTADRFTYLLVTLKRSMGKATGCSIHINKVNNINSFSADKYF